MQTLLLLQAPRPSGAPLHRLSGGGGRGGSPGLLQSKGGCSRQPAQCLPGPGVVLSRCFQK